MSELGSDRPSDLSDPRELVALLYPVLFVLLAPRLDSLVAA